MPMSTESSLPLYQGKNGEDAPVTRVTFHTARNVIKYVGKRTLAILLTIVVGTFITIVAANGGGMIDKGEQSRLSAILVQTTSNYYQITPNERQELLTQLEEKEGLNLPFLPRHLLWTFKALALDWGNVINVSAFRPLYSVPRPEIANSRVILLQYLPNTILLIATAFLLLFLVGIPLALYLSQHPGDRLDRLMGVLTPLSSIPSWVIGLLLIIVFAAGLRIFPYGRMTDSMIPDTTSQYILMVAWHMCLPVITILLTIAFTLVFSWRTYFLTYSDEDYVELGKAKGLSVNRFRRNYILRPVLPSIITSFSLSLVGFWQMITTLEYVFTWPGIGWLFVKALPNYLNERFYPGEMPIIIGTMVIFAYLLGLTVLLLDIAYVIVDPRLRIGGNIGTLHLKFRRTSRKSLWRKSHERFQPAIPHLKLPTDPGSAVRRSISNGRIRLREGWNSVKVFGQELRRYPSAIFGLGLVAILVSTSIFTIFALPYDQIGRGWFVSAMTARPLTPKLALPEWVNFFRKNDLPQTIILDSRTGDAQKVEESQSGAIKTMTLTYSFDYPYIEFPNDMVIYYYPRYEQKVPFASVTITTPDGRVIELRGVAATTATDYAPGSSVRSARMIAENENWQKWFVVDGLYPTPSLYLLFADPKAESPKAISGTYKVQIHVMTFEENSDLDAQLVVFGQVYGLAGTDYLRRDLLIPLLWGMPIALLFGLFGALAITIASALVGAVAAWYSGWMDGLLQWVIEANMILPVLAVGILFNAYYHVNLWLILATIVLLNIFGSPAKTFRAAFLQIKDTPYVEAARAYGASNLRIIWRYLIPRITSVMLPQLIALIPSFAFLEATFALFNVSDVKYPTWGLVIQTAFRSSTMFTSGSRFWVLEPIALLLLTGIAFGMSGAAFDRILNPRLRTK